MAILENPTRITSYDITLYCNLLDISRFIKRFQIVGDIGNTYINIIFNLTLDFKDFAIDNKLYGANTLTFTMTHSDAETNPIDFYVANLEIIQSNLSLAVHSIDAYESDTPTMMDSVKQDIILVTIPSEPLEKLSIPINFVSKDNDPKTAFDTIKQILTDNKITTLDPTDPYSFDERDINTQTIRQLCIPPMSINKMISFMNVHYGIYKGPLFYFCDTDGIIKMWNLKTRYNNDQPKFVIHHYAIDNKAQHTIDDEIQKLIIDLSRPEGNFMSVTPVDILKTGNSDVIQSAYNHFAVLHPPNDLFSTAQTDTETLIQEAGLYDKNTDYPSSAFFHKFKRNYFSSCNENKDDVLIKATSAINFITSAPMRVKIRGYCRFSYFLQVGVPCNVVMYTTQYKDYGGKYILGRSIIDVTRGSGVEWATSVKLLLYRSI